jgi:putative toxin-antitoxin system antitoxin component (TIGR02293 family)
MGASKKALLRQLGLSRATIDRKVKNDRALSMDEGQRVIGMAKLVGLVETMAEQSDNSDKFDAAKWLAKWIDQELPALDGKKPAEFLDTAEGQELVANTLQRMQTGAYS